MLRVSAHSDVGRVRKVNEDSYFVRPPVFLVADGMGGHHYGDRASQTVAETFAEAFPVEAPADSAEVLAAITKANERIRDLITDADGPGALSGTTLAGLALVDMSSDEESEASLHWMIYNVGDSRVYGWNGAELVQITVDHSAVEELVRMGLLTSEEAAIHPDRNVVTRAVGSDVSVHPDTWVMPTRGHQIFLLCSDGLIKELSGEQISDLISDYASQEDPEHSLAEVLVNAAVAAGGRDNVTVVVVESASTNGSEAEETPTVSAEE